MLADAMTDPSRKRRILLILEDVAAREEATSVLTEGGYDVHSRTSPIGATVEIVRSDIDVVVVDVGFDVMSGDRFAELIRRNDRLDHVGLILVSGGKAEAAQRLAQNVGADAGLAATSLEHTLLHAVEAALARGARRRSASTPPPGSTTALVLCSDVFAIALEEGRQLIGRDPACRFVINDPSVSRRHAAIEVRGVRARIEDLGSHNGTKVNETLIEGPTDLDVGDLIRVGQIELVLRVKTMLTRETVEIDEELL
jgi:CheY-like chemotaxis protein